MEPIELQRTLKKMGAATLSQLVGENRLETIQKILPGKVTESKLAEILMKRYGTQILANKAVRNAMLPTFTKPQIAYLIHGDENASVDVQTLATLETFKWSRTSDIAINFIKLFGLSDTYLPVQNIKVPSIDTLGCDTVLYPYQKRIKDSFVRSLISGINRLLIHMPTGAGKTRTTTEGLVDYWRAQGDYNGFMIWLTDSEELCTQAEETFAKLWKVRGDRPIKLLRLWGSHHIDNLGSEGGLIIASLQKLNRMRTGNADADFKLVNEIHSRSRLIVVDEAHKSIAPTYKATIDFICDLNNTKLVGLTATPGRTVEGQIEDLVEFYGNHRLTITDEAGTTIEDPIKFLQDEKYLSEITRKRVATDITVDLTAEEQKAISEFFELPQRVINELSKNDQRNLIIIQEIAKLYEEKRQIIVFGCSVEHSHLLTELLMIRGIAARGIYGSTPSEDRTEYIGEFKSGKIKVLVNYGVLTTGFDAPNTNAVVITRPTGSLVLYSQMIGRGIRGLKMGGTEDCILVDLEDNLKGYPSEHQAFNYFNDHWRNA